MRSCCIISLLWRSSALTPAPYGAPSRGVPRPRRTPRGLLRGARLSASSGSRAPGGRRWAAANWPIPRPRPAPRALILQRPPLQDRPSPCAGGRRTSPFRHRRRSVRKRSEGVGPTARVLRRARVPRRDQRPASVRSRRRVLSLTRPVAALTARAWHRARQGLLSGLCPWLPRPYTFPASRLAVKALASWIATLASRATGIRSLTTSPLTRPLGPQWYGRPIVWSFLPSNS